MLAINVCLWQNHKIVKLLPKGSFREMWIQHCNRNGHFYHHATLPRYSLAIRTVSTGWLLYVHEIYNSHFALTDFYLNSVSPDIVLVLRWNTIMNEIVYFLILLFSEEGHKQNCCYFCYCIVLVLSGIGTLHIDYDSSNNPFICLCDEVCG